MPDTVTVSEAQGARYTWASAGFTWSSASAAKNWSAAYPAAYTVAVTESLVLLEATARQSTKRASEQFGLAELLAKQSRLHASETVGFGETYSDLIAFVLRWVETMAFTEVSGKATRKEFKEAFQASDYLTRALTKTSKENLAWSDGLRQNGTKRLAESLPFLEVPVRGVTKNAFEAFGLGDGMDRAITKHVSETLALAASYTDLIAFMLRISEGLGLSDVGAKQITKPFQEVLGMTDKAARQSVKRVAEAVALGEALGRAVAYRRHLSEVFSVSDALRKAMRLSAREALALAEQYRRHANGVISDMLVARTEMTEQDFAAIVEAGHPPGYTDFRDFIQGDYTYRRALFRAILRSRNSDRGFIEALRVTVDVPDIFDRGTAQITDAAAGAVISFSRNFRVPPEVTMTHKGGTAVSIPRLLGAVTTTGFTAVLDNTSGTRVSGAFTWIAQGY